MIQSNYNLPKPLDTDVAMQLSEQTSEVLRSAIESELRSIISEGVNIPMLQQLHRFANTAQELLMIRSPLAAVRRRNRKNSCPSPPLGFASGGTQSFSEYQSSYGYESEDPLTTEAAQNETFGAAVTRQIVSMLGALKRNDGPSVSELIDGIREAESAGLDDVAVKLKAKLDTMLGDGELKEQDNCSESKTIETSAEDISSELAGATLQ